MQRIAFTLAAALCCGAAAAEQQQDQPSSWQFHNPWASTGEAPPPPRPYQLPRFDDTAPGDHYTQTLPLQTAPRVDAESLFYSVLSCYPEKSKFNLDVQLETRYGSRSTLDATGVDYGQHYIGVVARMPLYSATEMSRERDREYSRRTDTAKVIGDLMAALAARNHALRELGLYSSLEARAQVRVQQGVTDASEQVRYLEKVAGAQQDLIKQESALVEHRLSLIGQCSDDRAPELNAHIKRLTARGGQDAH